MTLFYIYAVSIGIIALALVAGFWIKCLGRGGGAACLKPKRRKPR
jgi:hypothetical protein